jgi:hypothetical protein
MVHTRQLPSPGIIYLMDSHSIAIRAHDINHGIVGVSMAPIEAYCRPTRLTGTAAQIASLVADQDVVPYSSVVACCAELQISGELTDRALETLSEVDVVRVVSRGPGKMIEVRTLGLRERYSQLGDYWTNSGPSNIETLLINLLNDLALMPRKAHEITAFYEMSNVATEMVKAIGVNTGVLRTYKSPVDGEEIWFSPIYWEENPGKLFDLAKLYPSDDIAAAISRLKSHTGLPDTMVGGTVLRDAINTGIFPTPSIDSSGGEHHFAFLPPKGLKLEEKPIADKAMALVACARYAEYFAQYKLIYPPVVLLQALQRKKELRPHPEAGRQWGPLLAQRVVRMDEVAGGKFKISLIDTPENLQALRAAIQLLEVGEAEYDDNAVKSVRQLVIPGLYSHPTKARVAFRRSPTYSESPLQVVHKIISGVSPDLIE